ncbi:MAG: hypothetical protein B6I36_02795 [Desulfobacteraceae bacterium 4572_35.1]|nr:MAG: hypothetical protein B6I36_02795 [Desulfobacteraceae bacterium 4572_35.1]
MSEKSKSQQRQMWILFFILGVIMLNFPFIQIFNRPETIFGIPVFILYILCGWPFSIVVIYLFSRTIIEDNNKQSTGDNNDL